MVSRYFWCDRLELKGNQAARQEGNKAEGTKSPLLRHGSDSGIEQIDEKSKS
jgi:hypothetical protein